MNSISVLCLILPVVLSSVVPAENQFEGRDDKSDGLWFFSKSCNKLDFSTCLGVKAISLLSRMARTNNIQVFDSLSLSRTEENDDRSGRALTVGDIENTLPDDPNERSSRLYDLLEDALINFLKHRSVEVRLDDTARALQEGRGKIKKYILPLIIGIVGKIVLVGPIILGGLALLVVKALIVAKIAFLLAAALGLPRLLGGLGGLGKGSLGSSGSGSAGWSSSGGPYYRSFDDNHAQDLAYSAQAPQ